MSEQNEGRALNDVAKWTMIGQGAYTNSFERVKHEQEQAAYQQQGPVSSQLTRIETSVAALNANHKWLAEQAAAILEGQARLNGLVDGLKRWQEDWNAKFSVMSDRLAAIEAKLEANDIRWASIDRRIAEIFGFMAKGQQRLMHRMVIEQNKRLASKKPPSKKA